jgi:peroxiredoxin (alkyl hydroperoxide reductase subunit C)
VYESPCRTVAERGATLFGVSCDATPSQVAFQEKLGVSIEQLSDSSPRRDLQGVRRAAPAASRSGRS